MKRKTRLAALVGAMALCAGAMAGCGGTGSTSSGASGSSGGSQGASGGSNSASPTLTWWAIGQQPDDLAAGLDAMNAYLEPIAGAKIDIKVASWGDWDEKINTIVNSGEKFDMMFTNNTKYSRHVNMGAFADITDMVQSEAPELWSFIPEKVWDGTKIGGRIYAVPTYKDSSITQYWYFDDVYVQKYGIDVSGGIKTLQDLDKPFRDMKAGEGAGFYPLQLSQGSIFAGFFNDYDGLTAGLQPLGVRVDDAGRKVVSILEQPDVMEDLKLLHQWYMDGIINPDAPTQVEPQKQLPFSTAQGYPGAEAQWQILNGVEKYDTWQVFGPMYTTETIQGSLNAVSANSDYKAECLKVLQTVNLDSKMRDMLAFGIEGQHFEYVGENVIHKKTDTWTLPAYSQATFFTMSTLDDAPADQWEQVKMLNEQAMASVCLGFALDINDISSELANCRAVWDKYRYEMLTGASDPETAVPQCMSDLRAAGFDTIVSEAQKQIDAFFAA